MKQVNHIAVMIDADNTRLSCLEHILDTLSQRGRVEVRRAYGNWRKDALKNWQDVTRHLAIKAVQQFDYTTDKNATDMALVIDTMDLLYREHSCDCFVLISSDSDYTPLAIRLREAGRYVIGVGEQKTPEAFRCACDEFMFLEHFETTGKKPGTQQPAPAKNPAITLKPLPKSTGQEMKRVHQGLKQAWKIKQQPNGFVRLSDVGTVLRNEIAEFDPKHYGYKKLSDLIAAFPRLYDYRSPDQDDVSAACYRCL